jgi:hypothetical protein
MVASQAAKTGVTKKAVTARGIGNQAEIILAAEVIYPRKRRIGPGYYKLPGLVIEETISFDFAQDRSSFCRHNRRSLIPN